MKIREKLERILFEKNIYGFISPSVDVESKREALYNLIENPDFGVVAVFENNLASFLGSGKVATFASGRMAFYTLLKIWGVKPGDEVVLTGFTCSVMVNAVLRLGATPVFCDIDRNTLGMSATDLNKKITRKSKVIVAQHSFGIPCEIDRIREIAEKKKIYLVEDCALSFGSSYKGIRLGNWGDAAIFSTDHTKPLNTLVGGFAYTNDLHLYEEVMKIKDELPTLTKKHQRMIIDRYILEHKIEKRGHKFFVYLEYLSAAKRKLWNIDIENPYLNYDSTCNCTAQSNYPYPANLPPSLAFIGVESLELYKQSIRERKQWVNNVINIVGEAELLPNAYSNKDCDIVPLRVAFVMKNHKLSDFRFIDDWVWFKKPIIATESELAEFGYKEGDCPVSEEVGRDIMNFPVIIHPQLGERFLRRIMILYQRK